MTQPSPTDAVAKIAQMIRNEAGDIYWYSESGHPYDFERLAADILALAPSPASVSSSEGMRPVAEMSMTEFRRDVLGLEPPASIDEAALELLAKEYEDDNPLIAAALREPGLRIAGTHPDVQYALRAITAALSRASTAEIDRERCFHIERDQHETCVACGDNPHFAMLQKSFVDGLVKTCGFAERARAAEAEVRRLREALSTIKEMAEVSAHLTGAHDVAEIASLANEALQPANIADREQG